MVNKVQCVQSTWNLFPLFSIRPRFCYTEIIWGKTRWPHHERVSTNVMHNEIHHTYTCQLNKIIFVHTATTLPGLAPTHPCTSNNLTSQRISRTYQITVIHHIQNFQNIFFTTLCLFINQETRISYTLEWTPENGLRVNQRKGKKMTP